MIDHYLWVSVAVGLAQAFDCLIYLLRKGRVSATGWVFSATEWVWGGVSAYVLIRGANQVPAWLPSVYIAYLALWTIYGVSTSIKHQKPSELTLTPREALAGGAFGLLFALASLLVAI